MTGVLGYPLETAVGILQSEGFAVETTECRSKKGLAGADEPRVVKQETQPNGGVLLTIAAFHTEPAPEAK